MPIKMNFTPAYVIEYARNLAAHANTDPKTEPAQRAMLADIVTMLEIAAGVMEPVPAEPGENKK